MKGLADNCVSIICERMQNKFSIISNWSVCSVCMELKHCERLNKDQGRLGFKNKKAPEKHENTAADDYLDYLSDRW